MGSSVIATEAPVRAFNIGDLTKEQRRVLDKVQRAFEGLLGPNPWSFFLTEGVDVEVELQLWDCFADVSQEIVLRRAGGGTKEDRRQSLADMMIWATLGSCDAGDRRFLVEPHKDDSQFLLIGQLLHERMVRKGLVHSSSSQTPLSHLSSTSCSDVDACTCCSNWDNTSAVQSN